jgi:hypothetical protein
MHRYRGGVAAETCRAPDSPHPSCPAPWLWRILSRQGIGSMSAVTGASLTGIDLYHWIAGDGAVGALPSSGVICR